jgi:Signal transduction histidine kinase
MRSFFKKHLNLAISLVIFVFFVMAVTFVIVGGTAVLLQHFGVVSLQERYRIPFTPLLFLIFICILLGTALTWFFGKKALNPIKKVIAATHKVAAGDFNVKVDLKGIGELEELSQSFNKMTSELASLETLRSDFVNNFSHEFKTPIVSIRGFAKLLRENNLTEPERIEYLDIIISESERLAQLSSNILDLSKYENTNIISEKTRYRLDEQLRRIIVLLEPKWSAKEITVNVELDEIIYSGNEDLMQRLWLNLIDNAIKFSYNGGCINISLKLSVNGIEFIIEDEGIGMSEQTIAHIFDKFYQGDTSRSRCGNGLGLTLAKRIVDLCGGKISVKSDVGKGSIFTVVLPVCVTK